MAYEKTTINLGDGDFKIKEGSLSKQLGIPVKDNIPMALLKKLVKKEIGSKFMLNGKERKMTTLLKRRVSLAITLKSRNKKATHKMPDGTIMTGKTHSKSSKKV